VKRRIGSRDDKFVEGFVTTSLLFCTGSMAILGAIEEGLGGFPNLLMAKSLLDGIASIALAASLGAGVLLASVPLFLYQGALTLFAGALQSARSEPLINEVSAVGGLLLLGLGISILEIKAIRVVNMLPSLLLALLLAAFSLIADTSKHTGGSRGLFFAFRGSYNFRDRRSATRGVTCGMRTLRVFPAATSSD
jgi:uncharacterized membrane protein YqgA involved in biofilm formation